MDVQLHVNTQFLTSPWILQKWQIYLDFEGNVNSASMVPSYSKDIALVEPVTFKVEFLWLSPLFPVIIFHSISFQAFKMEWL